jgi:hypothetical protein
MLPWKQLVHVVDANRYDLHVEARSDHADTATECLMSPVDERIPSGKIRIDQPPPVSSPMYCSV